MRADLLLPNNPSANLNKKDDNQQYSRYTSQRHMRPNCPSGVSMMDHFPAQLDFSGHQKSSYSATGNGYLPSTTILDVIQGSAVYGDDNYPCANACLASLWPHSNTPSGHGHSFKCPHEKIQQYLLDNVSLNLQNHRQMLFGMAETLQRCFHTNLKVSVVAACGKQDENK